MTLKRKKTVSSCETSWVLGGGKFGRRAAEQLHKVYPGSAIVIVDREPIENLPNNIKKVSGDGIEWFTKNFTPTARVNRIVPALPVHLAADWIKRKFKDDLGVIRSIEIPAELVSQIPHPICLNPHRLVTSYADFLCPENCSEPDDFCTYTKKPRPTSLDRYLATVVSGEFVPLILTSRQFAPGVGGFFPEDLWVLLDGVRLLPETPLLIGTACKCHGIIDGLCHGPSQPKIFPKRPDFP